MNPARARPITLAVVVAPNSFKGTLSAAEAAQAIAAGVDQAWPRSEVVLKPLADGGDGFLDTLLAAAGGRRTEHQVPGPLGSPVIAPIGWLASAAGESAVIEMASCCGLTLVPAPGPASAGLASSRGLGELLRLALAPRPVQVLVGLGGSASTDGGAGVAQALGCLLLDRHGDQIPPGGLGLLELVRIEATDSVPALRPGQVVAACDVTNPLLGQEGAAAVYGPQKGADPETVDRLERGLEQLARVVAQDLGIEGLENRPGMGAAGGAGFGLASFCGAQLTSGVELVASVVGLDQALDQAELVFTGEGRFDEASLQGKVVGEVLRRSAARDLPCVVLAGSADRAVEDRVSRRRVLVVSTLPPGTAAGNLTAERAVSDLRAAAARACRELSEARPGWPVLGRAG